MFIRNNLTNIDTFRRQWGNTSVKGQLVLPEAALKALDNLRNHAEKGCLSDIPVSCDTDRNENLHKRTIKQGKIGIQLAVSLPGSYSTNGTKGNYGRIVKQIVKFFGVHTTI